MWVHGCLCSLWFRIKAEWHSGLSLYIWHTLTHAYTTYKKHTHTPREASVYTLATFTVVQYLTTVYMMWYVGEVSVLSNWTKCKLKCVSVCVCQCFVFFFFVFLMNFSMHLHFLMSLRFYSYNGRKKSNKKIEIAMLEHAFKIKFVCVHVGIHVSLFCRQCFVLHACKHSSILSECKQWCHAWVWPGVSRLKNRQDRH